MRGVQARLGAIGLALFFAAACATTAAPAPGMAGRFVTRDDGKAAERATFDVAPAERADRPAAAAPGAEPVPVVPIPKYSEPNSVESEDPALAASLSALRTSPSVAAHRRVAAEYWRLKVFDRAERHLTLALSLAPRDAMLIEERARLWRDAGVLDRALSDAHTAAYRAPSSAQAQNTLGTVLFALGRVTEARDRFARAAALAPVSAYVQNNLCYANYVTREFEAALAACDVALSVSPGFEAARRNRALVGAAITAGAERQRTEGTP